MAYSPGFFTDGSNGGFTTGLSANTIAAANTELYPTWRVCDGSYLNDSSSMYFNGSGRYVPNLTDDRFIMGDTACGNIGGTSTMAHIHSMSHDHGSFSTYSTTISTSQMPSHSHNTRTNATGVDPSGTKNVLGTDTDGYDTATTGGGGSHNHTLNPPYLSAVTGSSTITENRPRFLSTFYIIKVR
jgi:microcystin-dependent protein